VIPHEFSLSESGSIDKKCGYDAIVLCHVLRHNLVMPLILLEVKYVVALGADKGGAGKTTAAVLLAVGMRRSRAKVGLMDADIYGPSVPTMMGLL